MTTRALGRYQGGMMLRACCLSGVSTMIQALWMSSEQPQSAWVRKWEPVVLKMLTASRQAFFVFWWGISIKNLCI